MKQIELNLHSGKEKTVRVRDSQDIYSVHTVNSNAHYNTYNDAKN